jgi:uncharacterized protein (TIGR02246 family)
MRHIAFALALALFAPAAALAQQPAAATLSADRSAVEAMLAQSAERWSAGDLDGFLQSYVGGGEALFVGGPTPLRGRAAIRAMYAKSFGTTAAAMGRLGLEVVDFRPLGPDHAFVLARFTVVKEGQPKPLTGYSSLTVVRTGEGWRILTDHS